MIVWQNSDSIIWKYKSWLKTNTNFFSGSVPPKGVASIEATIVPSRAGLRKLIVDIDAKEQKDFKGEGEIFINPWTA